MLNMRARGTLRRLSVPFLSAPRDCRVEVVELVAAAGEDPLCPDLIVHWVDAHDDLRAISFLGLGPQTDFEAQVIADRRLPVSTLSTSSMLRWPRTPTAALLHH
jgi:hypothetical protein